MNLQEKITACLETAVASHEAAGLTVLACKNGEELLYAQAGVADVDKGTPVARDSIFRLYSQSKPITAAAAMLLMERGVIDLQDPVEKFLPGFRGQKVYTPQGLVPAKRPVMVMDLLGMVSGLCYPDGDAAGQYAVRLFDEAHQRIRQGNGMTTVEFANRMGELPLAFQPGEHFRYGTSADVLGAVVEVASGRPFARFLEEELFAPLGMKDTAMFVPEEKRGRFVTCHQRVPGGVVPFHGLHLAVGDYDAEPAFASGGAGLVSTLDDYAAFAEMLLCGGEYRGKRIMSRATADYMTRAQLGAGPQRDMWDGLTGYGYGKLMRVCIDPGQVAGLALPGEYGWDGWLGTYFVNLPTVNTTILLMQNTKDTGTATVTRKVRNLILAEL